MGNLFRRLLDAIFDAISFVFNLGIRLKYVVALLILFVGGAVGLTYAKMLGNVGGKSDYDEAMRYIQLKDLIQDHFIDPVDRKTMTEDRWEEYMY